MDAQPEPLRRLVVASTPVAATPTVLPERFARVASPVHRSGVADPVDWEVSPSVVLASQPASELAEFRRWRRRFVAEFNVAEAFEVDQLARFAARAELALLARLVAPCAAVFGPEDLEDLDAEIGAAGALAAAERGTGLVFSDAADATVLRVASAPQLRTFAAAGADGDWEVAVSPAYGLRLRLADEVATVLGWEITADGLAVSTAASSPLRVSGPPARALAQLAPAAVRVVVRRVPAAEVFAVLLAALDAAVVSAATSPVQTVVVAPRR